MEMQNLYKSSGLYRKIAGAGLAGAIGLASLVSGCGGPEPQKVSFTGTVVDECYRGESIQLLRLGILFH